MTFAVGIHSLPHEYTLIKYSQMSRANSLSDLSPKVVTKMFLQFTINSRTEPTTLHLDIVNQQERQLYVLFPSRLSTRINRRDGNFTCGDG